MSWESQRPLTQAPLAPSPDYICTQFPEGLCFLPTPETPGCLFSGTRASLMELTSEEYGHQGAPPDGFLKSHRLPVYAKAESLSVLPK